MHWPFLGFALFAVLPIPTAIAAGKNLPIPTDSASKIRIEIGSWLDACPPAGMSAFVLRINNGSNAPHDWTLTVTDGHNARATTTIEVRVEAGRTGEVPFVAASALKPPGNHYRAMNFVVSGFGARGSFAQLQQPDTLTRGARSSTTPFIAMSAELSAAGWSALSDRFDKTGSSGTGSGIGLDASQADLSRAPDDWRGYSGVTQLWMTDGEWSAMSGGAKAAMMDWIALGGRAVVFVRNLDETALAGLRLPPKRADGERRRTGPEGS